MLLTYLNFPRNCLFFCVHLYGSSCPGLGIRTHATVIVHVGDQLAGRPHTFHDERPFSQIIKKGGTRALQPKSASSSTVDAAYHGLVGMSGIVREGARNQPTINQELRSINDPSIVDRCARYTCADKDCTFVSSMPLQLSRRFE
jgi:hypothetical protein